VSEQPQVLILCIDNEEGIIFAQLIGGERC